MASEIDSQVSARAKIGLLLTKKEQRSEEAVKISSLSLLSLFPPTHLRLAKTVGFYTRIRHLSYLSVQNLAGKYRRTSLSTYNVQKGSEAKQNQAYNALKDISNRPIRTSQAPSVPLFSLLRNLCTE